MFSRHARTSQWPDTPSRAGRCFLFSYSEREMRTIDIFACANAYSPAAARVYYYYGVGDFIIHSPRWNSGVARRERHMRKLENFNPTPTCRTPTWERPSDVHEWVCCICETHANREHRCREKNLRLRARWHSTLRESMGEWECATEKHYFFKPTDTYCCVERRITFGLNVCGVHTERPVIQIST